MSSGPLFLEAFFTRAFTQHLLFSLVPALGPFLLAAAGATALTPLAMLLARRLGVVALPGGRHIHLRPTPLLGGWALYLAFAGAVAWYLGVSDWKIVGLLSLCGVATLLFTYDDRFRMAAPAKLAVEIGLGLVAVFVFGFNISFFTLPGGHVIQLGLVAYPLTVLWLLGMQNTINLLDGVDGLAAGVVAIVAAVLAVAAISKGDQEGVVLLSAALAGCCLGFLIFNFHPARIFMGDSGSMLIGLMLAASVTSLTGQFNYSNLPPKAAFPVLLPVLLPLAVLAVPLVDLLLAVVRRTRAGRSPFSPDKMHLHHRLLEIGHSHKRAVLIMYFWTALVAFSVVAVSLAGALTVFGVAASIAVVGLVVLNLPRLRDHGS